MAPNDLLDLGKFYNEFGSAAVIISCMAIVGIGLIARALWIFTQRLNNMTDMIDKLGPCFINEAGEALQLRSIEMEIVEPEKRCKRFL